MNSINKALDMVNLVKILLFNESRKVGFGLWLFLVSSWLLLKGSLITSEQWMTCVMLCSALLGGGTIADKWLSNQKGGQDVIPTTPKS
jgi:hypothetical protein